MALTDLIPPALQLYNYIEGQDSARKVSDNVNKGYDEGIAYTKDTFDPYIEKGHSALNRWDNLLEDPSSITSDPGYEFGVTEGQQALERSAAGKGDLLSGQTLLDVNQWGQDYGQTYYDKSLSRNSDMARMGLNAGSFAAPEISRMQEGKGDANASRELLQQMNRQQLVEGGVDAWYGPGGPGSEGAWMDTLGGMFGGEFGDDLSTLVSGSIFDPDTWGDMLGLGGGVAAGGLLGGATVGGTFWDAVGAIPDFFGTPAGLGAVAGIGRLGYGMLTGEEFSGSVAAGGGAAAGTALGTMIMPGLGTVVGGILGSTIGSKLGKAIGFSGTGGGEDKADYGVGVGGSRSDFNGDRNMASVEDGPWGLVGVNYSKHFNSDGYQNVLDGIIESDKTISTALTQEQNDKLKAELGKPRGVASNSNEGGYGPGRMLGQFIDDRKQVLKSVLGTEEYDRLQLDEFYDSMLNPGGS